MSDVKIIVCVKQVPDPEGPPSSFKVDLVARKVIPVGIPPVINPFDENALEAALKLRDSHGGTVIALSVGMKLARPVLRKALNVGADQLVLLEDECFQELDSRSTAVVLAAGIKKLGRYDLILAGRQASDWNFGQIGPVLAEILQLPVISLAQKLMLESDRLIIQKLRQGGHEVVTSPLPALVTASNEIGSLRTPSLKAIKEAAGRPISVWGARELEIDPAKLTTRKLHALRPPSTHRDCLLIDGESPEDKAQKLALKLREDKIL